MKMIMIYIFTNSSITTILVKAITIVGRRIHIQGFDILRWKRKLKEKFILFSAHYPAFNFPAMKWNIFGPGGSDSADQVVALFK